MESLKIIAMFAAFAWNKMIVIKLWRKLVILHTEYIDADDTVGFWPLLSKSFASYVWTGLANSIDAYRHLRCGWIYRIEWNNLLLKNYLQDVVNAIFLILLLQ